jgi:hypothetical protein
MEMKITEGGLADAGKSKQIEGVDGTIKKNKKKNKKKKRKNKRMYRDGDFLSYLGRGRIVR